MGIYRGAGGSGDAINDSSSEALITIQARDQALAAQAAAEAAQAAAELAETNAETAETNAETAETNAETAATNAANSASAASTSASNAASSASAASTSASNASTSATNAANSASAASTSASNAASSASTASTQATNASNSASAAATSATNASNSASAAATSATNAANSATAAQTARTAAELAETNAETAEANAETAETNAAASASAAATSASNASTSASNAATSATNASNSASAAATSATNASNSASAAATSATNASNSASAAATSATNAAASYDSFDDRYLGAKSTAPTLDNDGNTLLVGALYYDTVSSSMKVWSGSAWLDAYASLSGALLATNNLSDLNNTATARTNLGVAIGVNVQAWDADLDTWATKTAPSGTVVGTSDSQTLTNKTLTTPVISTISNTGTLTLPTSTDTLVGRATSDTLTNKTIALGSNTVSGTLAQFNTAVTDADLVSIAGSETLTNKTLTSPTINTATISGGTINNAAIGGTTPAAGSFTSLTDSGNLTFTGTGNRITGDFSNATQTNRVVFQTSITNGNSIIGIIPNGTATTSVFRAFNNSDPTNASEISLFAASADVRVISGITGTGSYLPLTMYTGGSERLRIDTSGNVGIGTSAPNAKMTLVQASEIYGFTIQGNSTSQAGSIRFTNAGFTAEQALLQSINGGGLILSTAGSERMRIDSSGNVVIGTTASLSSYKTTIQHTSGELLALNASSGTLTRIAFGNADTSFGATQIIANSTSLALITGAAERMRIDSSGNVGIGTSSPTNLGSTVRTLELTAGSSAGGGGYYLSSNGTTTTQLGTDGVAGYIGTRSNHPAVFTTNNTERMRIDSSGNVGIGTSSPSQVLEVSKSQNTETQVRVVNANTGSSARSGFVLGNNSNAGAASLLLNSSNNTGLGGANALNMYQGLSAPIVFFTDATERMRITSGGDLLVAASISENGNTRLSVRQSGAGNNCIWAHNTSTSDGASKFVASTAVTTASGTHFFYDAGYNWSTSFARAFAVRGDGVIFALNTTIQSLSDQRLKENIVDSTDGLSVITALRPVRFDWKKETGILKTNQLGFIAQEVEQVFPDAVDTYDNSNDPQDPYKSVGSGALIPVLVKAIQELKAELDATKAEIALLKSK